MSMLGHVKMSLPMISGRCFHLLATWSEDLSLGDWGVQNSPQNASVQPVPSRLSIDLAATRRTPLVRNSWNHQTEPVRNPGVLVCAASNSMLEIWLHNLHMKFTMEFILKQCFRIFPAFFMEMFPQKALAQGPLSLLFPKNYLLSTTAGNWILFNLAGAQKSG